MGLMKIDAIERHKKEGINTGYLHAIFHSIYTRHMNLVCYFTRRFKLLDGWRSIFCSIDWSVAT
jgi:hypothetical protein